MPNYDQIGFGKLVRTPNYSLRLFGYNPDIDTAAAEDVWAGGGDYPWPAAAAATTIVSDSANDASAGTGGRTVRVSGLSSTGATIAENVTLNGTTPVALQNQYLRINVVNLLTAGSGGTNAGNIDVKHSSTVISRMLPAQGHAQAAIYTVPADVDSGYVANFSIGLLGGSTFLVRGALMIRENGGAWRTVEILDVTNGLRSIANQDPSFWRRLPPLTDVRVRILSVGADNAVCTASIDMYVLK